jgi:hypothetical protein
MTLIANLVRSALSKAAQDVGCGRNIAVTFNTNGGGSVAGLKVGHCKTEWPEHLVLRASPVGRDGGAGRFA